MNQEKYYEGDPKIGVYFKCQRFGQHTERDIFDKPKLSNTETRYKKDYGYRK